MRRSAFVTNDALIGIMVAAVWLALALPIYAYGLRFLEGRGGASFAGRLLLLLVAFLVPWLLFKLILGVEWLAVQLGKYIRKRRGTNHREGSVEEGARGGSGGGLSGAP